ncbi:ABC transporter substrate-binding protein [Rhizobium laguerreae]|uniref:ABC transporter substrate-binding protein n=1 Tax=Rhizobium laguerreae TaxID=1076926 RepID=A0AB35FD93_9HYPH|nr:ABC transporter substrate-binding protein [Rhizobium laguerreae]MBY3064550.1 ABC transporter substrate-binding protein [Rhizobium laguerreae]
MTISKTLMSVGLISALAAGLTSTHAFAQEKKLTFSLSDQMRVSYYWLYLPEILGYWKKEGLSVDVQSVGGSLEALQQVMAGNADFGQMGALSVVQASAKGMPMQIAMMNGTFQWKLAVLADSAIKSVGDLKGKSIGVFSASTNGNDFLKAYLKKEKLNPDSDVTLLPVGFGASALEALRKGEVAALYYWPSAFISYEGQGLAFRYFQSPEWSHYADYSVAGLKKKIDADPKSSEGMVRAMVKATVFADANPDCAVKMFWKAHPDAKPTGVDDATALLKDTNMLLAQLHEGNSKSENIGIVTPDNLKSLQDFMLDAKLVEKTTEPQKMVVADGDASFFTRVNDFDKAAIVADAKACKL